MSNYINTSNKVQVEGYPYGFNQRTTLFDSMEFNPKKGYRHVTQTINPKTGKPNAPKKSTYYPLLVRFYDDVNHIKTLSFHFNGDKEINEGCEFLAANFDIFTPDEIKYFYSFIYSMAVVDMKATAIYGGSNLDELKPLYIPFLEICKKGIENGSNLFADLKLDTAAIDATKPEGFSPFKIKTYEIQ